MKKFVLTVALVVAVLIVAILAMVFRHQLVALVPSWDKLAEQLVDLLKSALGSLAGLALAYAGYVWREKRWGGWTLAVTNRQGETISKALPAAVAKEWLADGFSDFRGFRDLTGSVNRWPGCGLVGVDADEARRLHALVVDEKTKTVRFDYSKLPEAPAKPGPR